ncbi:MAG: DUF2334 domain-containing protein, partial [Firmicutes bacterium]|nr:DUF2334 domain-containing protein [Bacillota bacterium]
VIISAQEYESELLLKNNDGGTDIIGTSDVEITEEEKKEEEPKVTHIASDLVIAESNVKIKLANEDIKLDNKIIFGSGRVYLPIEIVEKLGGKIDKDGEKYNLSVNNKNFSVSYEGNVKDVIEKVIYVNEIPYIVINEFIKGSEYIPFLDSKTDTITLYYKGNKNYSKDNTLKSVSDPIKAYIRLEDIMPDGDNPDGDYNDEGLEKLRVMADYLNTRNQEFYIAWIPIYVNPALNITHDVSAKSTLYNADFIYTLDFMIDNGGHLGIHGLTHQYGNYVSADGYEFDYNCPWNTEEKEQRMIQATKIAKYLRVKYEFFEFPHYGALYDDFINAEKYFDMIYENNQYYYETANNIYTIEKEDGRKITYVPTPADYVHTEYDSTEMISKLEECRDTGKEVSLFFHPRLDFAYISGGVVDGNKRDYHYSDYVILPRIIDRITEMGYKFSEVEK